MFRNNCFIIQLRYNFIWGNRVLENTWTCIILSPGTLRDALWPLFYSLDLRCFIAKLSLVQSIFPYFYLICCFSWWRENTYPVLFCNMVIILNGNPEVGAHVWSEINNLTCLRHLSRSRAVRILKLFSRQYIFSLTCAMCSELPSNISTMATIVTDWTNDYRLEEGRNILV